jgi:hypothetical protein
LAGVCTASLHRLLLRWTVAGGRDDFERAHMVGEQAERPAQLAVAARLDVPAQVHLAVVIFLFCFVFVGRINLYEVVNITYLFKFLFIIY